MFKCNTCNKINSTRVELLLHRAKCNRTPRPQQSFKDLFSENLFLSDSDDYQEVDDSDKDETYNPSPGATAAYTSDSEPDSPLTREQACVATEVELVLQDFDPENISQTDEKASTGCFTTCEDPSITDKVTRQDPTIEEENVLLKQKIKELENLLSGTRRKPGESCEEPRSTPEPLGNTIDEPPAPISSRIKQKNEEKKYFCPYCKEMVGHFARHLLNKHKTEDKVLEISALDPKCTKRKQLISHIRGEGSLIYNTTYELNQGKLILARRRKTDINLKKMKPCVNCKNYYLSTTLYKHYRICTGKTNTPRDLQSKSTAISLNLENNDISNDLKQVLPGMDHDEVYDCLVTDQAIIDYGNYLCTRHKENHLKNMIRSKLRQLAKLTIQMKTLDPKINSLDDSLTPIHYDTFITAVNIVSKYDGNKFKSPSVVGELGRNMKLVANRRIIHCIKTDNEIKKRDIEKWLHIYSHDFYNTIGRNALRTVQKEKWGKTQLLPLTEDVMQLNNHIKKTLDNAETKLKHKFHKKSYVNLSKGVMADVQIFNRRRALEVEMLLIHDFEKRHNIQKGTTAYETLTESEKLISSRFMRIEARGKLHLKPASMLLSNQQIQQIHLILKYRKEAGVSDENPYVFAYKDSFYKAYQALKDLAYGSNAKNPDLLIGTILRKHIASTVQALNFTDSDMTNLAAFMSHDVLTHRNFYRLPNEAIHLAKLSRLLMAMDNGTISNFYGKALEEIDVNVCVSEVDDVSNDLIEQANDDEFETELVNDEGSCTHIEDQFSIPGPSGSLVSNKIGTKLCTETASHLPQKIKPTPPKGQQNKRASWATPERHAARQIFQKYLSPNKTLLPTPQECRDAIRQNKELQGRTINQLKGWLFSERNRIRKKSKK